MNIIFSDELITELKFRNEISEIISNYTHLSQKGKNMLGLCPFHAERTPSFCVYPSNNSFYCFGCGVGGDVITFLRIAEKYDYIEAVKYLADRSGVELKLDYEALETHNQKIIIYEINREAAKFYHRALIEANNTLARKYLVDRLLSFKTIKYFGLGFSPSGGFLLVDFLKKKGYTEKDIILSNLGVKNQSGKLRDRFFGRIMFPIIDLRGNVVAFGARTITDALPKYINTSDTPVFKKSINLFALNFANKSGNKNLILVEGYMDVATMHQAGFKNTVATLGTSITHEQGKLIARYTNEVIISYDSDEAGQKATDRAISILKANGLAIKVLKIPKGKDPDEYLRDSNPENVVRFKNLIESSENDTQYKLNILKKDYSFENVEGKIKYLTSASKILAEIQNPIEREVYVSKICEEAGVSTISVNLQIKKIIKQKTKKISIQNLKMVQKNFGGINDKVNLDKHLNLRACVAEEFLLSFIINNGDVANNIFKKVPEDLYITNFNKKIYVIIKNLVSDDKILDITNISKNLNFVESGRISKIINEYNPKLGTNTAVNEYIKVLKDEYEKDKIKKTENEEEIKKYIAKLKKKKK